MAPQARPEAAPLRQLIDAVRRRSADLTDDLHPGNLERGLMRLGLPGGSGVEGSPKCAAALAALYELQWPSLDRFRARAHRIALLPRRDMLRVLAAVSLDAERGRVRLSIGPGLRAQLIARVGEQAYGTLLESPPIRSASYLPFRAADLDAEDLAWRGLQTLVSIGAWRSRRLLRRVRLGFEPARKFSSDRPVRAHCSCEVLANPTSYFPEHSWLFGSPMDLALSASTTA